MNTAKIEQLRADIATLKAAEEVCSRHFATDTRRVGQISVLENELKRLEDAACQAEIVRVDRVKVGDKILRCRGIGEITKIKRDCKRGNVEISLKTEKFPEDEVGRYLFNELVTRIVDAPPDDTALKADIASLKDEVTYLKTANEVYADLNKKQAEIIGTKNAEIETLKAEIDGLSNECLSLMDETSSLESEVKRLRAERKIEIVKAGDLKEGDKFLWKTMTCKVMAKFSECESYVAVGSDTLDVMYFCKRDLIARIVEAKPCE